MPDPTDAPTSIPQPASNVPYLVAVVMMTLATITAMVLIELFRPGKDNAVILTLVAAQCVPATAAILGFMKTQETKALVNGHLGEFKALVKASSEVKSELANKQGQLQGAANEQARVQGVPVATVQVPVPLAAPTTEPISVVINNIDTPAAQKLADLAKANNPSPPDK